MSTSDKSRGWLLLLYTLPAKKSASRLSLWRKLKKTGAYLLRTSAYVLPDESQHFERFQWLAQQVRDAGGEATLARVTTIEGMADADLARLFNEARGLDYADIEKSLAALTATNRRKATPEFAESLEKLRRQFQEIRAIDFFDCPAAHDLEVHFQRADNLSGADPKRPGTLNAKRFQSRQWLTRPHPQIDRVGSAWLINKFIDPHAKFVFAGSPDQHPEAIPYDMADGEFTHHGEDCTFETLLKRFAIADPAARRIGEMIHDADLEDGKYQRPECVGLDLLFKGWHRLGLSDKEILEKGFACFDALYTAVERTKHTA